MHAAAVPDCAIYTDLPTDWCQWELCVPFWFLRGGEIKLCGRAANLSVNIQGTRGGYFHTTIGGSTGDRLTWNGPKP